MSRNPGTNVVAEIRVWDSLDTYASAWATEIRGGLHYAATIAARDVISDFRRYEGMMCYVEDDGTGNFATYQLQGGITNPDWVLLSFATTPLTHNFLSATHLDTEIYSPPTIGDLIVGTSDGGTPPVITWTHLGVGTDGFVPAADSTQLSGINWVDPNTLITETDPLSLHLDQSTPQTVINGAPIFDMGLDSNGQIRAFVDGTDAIQILSAATDYSKLSFGVLTDPSHLIEYTYIQSVASGTGTLLPISFWIDSGVGAIRAMDIATNGYVGVGISVPLFRFHSYDYSSYAIYGQSSVSSGVRGESVSGTGVEGLSTSSMGVYGLSDSEDGVMGDTVTGIGVHGRSDSGYSGVFDSLGEENLGVLIKYGDLTLERKLKILEGGLTPTEYTIFQGGDQTIALTYTLWTSYPAANDYVHVCSTAGVWEWKDVNGLVNLDDYFYLPGRAGGQVGYGGTAASNSLTLESTSHLTKGYIILQPTTGNVGIGTITPSSPLYVATPVFDPGGEYVYGVGFVQSFTAQGNNAEMAAFYINPTFNEGGYTGVVNYGILVSRGLVSFGDLGPRAGLTVAMDVPYSQSGIVRGIKLTSALIAQANRDKLIGLHLLPAYDDNSHTSVEHYALAIQDVTRSYDTRFMTGSQSGDINYIFPINNNTGYLKNTTGTWSWETTATPTNHNLLSAIHPDTTVGSTTRGDLITGQGSSPLWTKLALGTIGQIPYSDGTDLKYGDHGNIAGLGDDDHTQYFLLVGRLGSQLGYGATANTGYLTFKSDSASTHIPEISLFGDAHSSKPGQVDILSGQISATANGANINITAHDGGLGGNINLIAGIGTIGAQGCINFNARGFIGPIVDNQDALGDSSHRITNLWMVSKLFLNNSSNYLFGTNGVGVAYGPRIATTEDRSVQIGYDSGGTFYPKIHFDFHSGSYGFIGINTLVPNAQLDIWGGTNALLRFSYDLTHYTQISVDATGDINIDPSGTGGIVYIGNSSLKKLCLWGGTTPTYFTNTFIGSASQIANIAYTLPSALPLTSIVNPTAGNFLYTTSAGVMFWVDPLGGNSFDNFLYLPGRAAGQLAYGSSINTKDLTLVSDSASVHAPEIILHSEGSMSGIIPMGGIIEINSGRMSNLNGGAINLTAHDGNTGRDGGNINFIAGAKGAGGTHGYITFDAKGLIRPVVDNQDDFGNASYRLKDIYAAGNLSDGTNALTVANCKDAYDGRIPVGGMIDWSTTVAPAHFLLCDGASYSTTTYATLFAVIGYLYGGSGANFNVPNAKSRFTMGYESGVNSPGDTGGAVSNTPTFTGNALATHQHDAISAGTPAGTISNAPGIVYNIAAAAGKPTFSGTAMDVHQHAAITAGTPAGSISSVPTIPPYLVLSKIIRYE
jgi:microcystin-dependent protein